MFDPDIVYVYSEAAVEYDYLAVCRLGGRPSLLLIESVGSAKDELLKPYNRSALPPGALGDLWVFDSALSSSHLAYCGKEAVEALDGARCEDLERALYKGMSELSNLLFYSALFLAPGEAEKILKELSEAYSSGPYAFIGELALVLSNSVSGRRLVDREVERLRRVSREAGRRLFERAEDFRDRLRGLVGTTDRIVLMPQLGAGRWKARRLAEAVARLSKELRASRLIVGYNRGLLERNCKELGELESALTELGVSAGRADLVDSGPVRDLEGASYLVVLASDWGKDLLRRALGNMLAARGSQLRGLLVLPEIHYAPGDGGRAVVATPSFRLGEDLLWTLALHSTFLGEEEVRGLVGRREVAPEG